VAAPVKLQLGALRTQAEQGALPSLFRALVRHTRQAANARGDAAADLTGRLAAVGPADQERILLELVVAETATALGHATPAAIDPDRPFADIGFDSLTAVELRNRLGAATGVKLPSTLVFDHPTPAAVLRLLLAELGQEVDPTAALLADLDGIESALAALEPGDHSRVLKRLQALAARWDTSGGTELDLDAATDEEMFRLIDDEFSAS
jgi:acyl carrier protein